MTVRYQPVIDAFQAVLLSIPDDWDRIPSNPKFLGSRRVQLIDHHQHLQLQAVPGTGNTSMRRAARR